MKKKFDVTIATVASPISPGPTAASAAVPATQPAVDSASHHFLRARRSAYAPIIGIATITRALDTPSISVHANVAQSAFAATTPTKYALNTAVRTTVV